MTDILDSQQLDNYQHWYKDGRLCLYSPRSARWIMAENTVLAEFLW